MPIVNDLAAFLAIAPTLDFTGGALSVEVKPVGNKRGLPQNALAAIWYNQIDKAISYPVGATKCECKLFFGVPILRAENEKFREGYDKLIKHRMTQEEKLELMRWFPVTSLMSVKQMTRYMEAVQHYYAEQYHIVLDSTGAQ